MVSAARNLPSDSHLKLGLHALPNQLPITNFSEMYRSTARERVEVIRHGVPAAELKDMVRMMDVSQDRVFKLLKLSTATVNRKASRDETLSSEDSERVVGMSTLIGQVEAMVAQSGDPTGFDAAKWLAHWIEEPVPALGGACPAEYMDTIEGMRLVASILATMHSGAYA